MGERIKSEWISIWQSCRWLVVLVIVALLLDAMSTIHFMQYWGPEAELHPAVRLFSSLFGTVAGPILSALCKMIATLIVLFYLKSLAPVILFSVSVVSLFAFFYNLYAVDLYLKGVVPWLPF